jgi:integrase
MTKYNPQNERIKREYFTYLREAKRFSDTSLDIVAKALNRFECYTNFKDFKSFHTQQAVGFKARLSKASSERTGDQLSKATLHSTLNALKAFFFWLAGRPSYRSRFSYADADYFNLSEKDTRIAKAQHERPVPTMEQIRHTLRTMPGSTEIERRNRALLAFTILTGARDGALASLKVKHLDIDMGKVAQDAREVKTKFSKSFTTWFFPVGEEFRLVVVEWLAYLRDTKLWGPDDPLFPRTRVSVGVSGAFEAGELDRKHWSDAGPIRKVFKQAFEQAGLPYFHPHSFRKTLAQLGERVCTTPEEFKAWSQNLGHEGVLTTFVSYGAITGGRQGEILRSFQQRGSVGPSPMDLVQQLTQALQQEQGRR